MSLTSSVENPIHAGFIHVKVCFSENHLLSNNLGQILKKFLLYHFF